MAKKKALPFPPTIFQYWLCQWGLTMGNGRLLRKTLSSVPYEVGLWAGVDARKTHSSFPYKVGGHNITRCEL